eukprot:2869397-Alexandrium_andersonii.AAC.1
MLEARHGTDTPGSQVEASHAMAGRRAALSLALMPVGHGRLDVLGWPAGSARLVALRVLGTSGARRGDGSKDLG